MRQVISFLLIQEFYYGIFIVVVGAIIGFDKGWYVGLKSIMYLVIILQVMLFWINRKIIKAALNPNIKDKK